MKYFSTIMCALLTCFWHVNIEAASFFDMRDPEELVKQFRCFSDQQSFKISRFREIPKRNIEERRKVANDLIQVMAYYSGSINDTQKRKMDLLHQDYEKFYAAYYEQARENKLSHEMLHFLLLFSQLKQAAQ